MATYKQRLAKNEKKELAKHKKSKPRASQREIHKGVKRAVKPKSKPRKIRKGYPSIITVNIHKEKKVRRSKKIHKIGVLPRTKPQSTELYKFITR